MSRTRWIEGACLLSFSLPWICSCANLILIGKLSYAPETVDPLAAYALDGNTLPVLDPSVIRQGSMYYAFSTDVAGVPSSGSLPIRCSQDKVNWTLCGSVFPAGMPAWIEQKVQGVTGLWAPDVSYFNDEYHVYYNGSTHWARSKPSSASQQTLRSTPPILHTNGSTAAWCLNPKQATTSTPSIPISLSKTPMAHNLAQLRERLERHYEQSEIDPETGLRFCVKLSTRHDLAARPAVFDNAIEGASLIRHGGYYYLIVSVDHCCEPATAQDNYKQAVGRSTSPHGPFLDEAGTPMMIGGGTVLLQGDETWNAPGGGTAYVDPSSGESLLIFHAQDLRQGGTPHVWVKPLQWTNDWPGF